MHKTAREDLLRLLRQRSAPCVSIYLPTHRTYPDNQQDAVRYRRLVEDAEEELRKVARTSENHELIGKFRDLLDNETFWTERSDGLAVLGSRETFDVFDLERPVPERVIVSDSFHVKPLVRDVQSADQFHVLGLQRESIALFEGTRDRLERIEPAGVPLTARQALSDETPAAPGRETEDHNPPPGLSASVGDAKMELERFLRVIDGAVFEHLSRDTRCPLILAGLPELQAVFRALSRNPQLLPQGIERGVPAEIDDQFLRDAWACVEPRYRQRLDQLVNDFEVAKARGMAAEEVEAVGQAIAKDRVGILLIEADRVIPGHFDKETGAVSAEVSGDDLLDDFAETVLRTDGTALVLPKDRMPTPTGVAAIFRF